MEFLLSADLSDYGSCASIVGVILTFLTFILVFKIKKKFLFRSTVDDYKKSLDDISSNISNLFNSYADNIDDIDEAFAIADVKLRNIEKGANGDLLSDVRNARLKIKRYRSRGWLRNKNRNKNEPSAIEIITAINVVVEEFKNVKKELLVGA
jgi:uncharacterized membrane-anchored protein YhcB (DUF1043 family)